MGHEVIRKQMADFAAYLYKEELSKNTMERYLHDVESFFVWAGTGEITKERAAQWKEHLCRLGYAAVTVNAALAALHRYLVFIGKPECRLKYLKIQRRVFRDASKELTKEEYRTLVSCAAAQGNPRLALLMETICATGIRVSEVSYITVEAARRGRAEIALKGKIRTILLPNKLTRKLLKYAKKQQIISGEIFLTSHGTGISRHQIWSEMKRLCKSTGIDEQKVFPHNLRHLFARAFYRTCRDIVRLADVLGHSSIETTRIYLMTTGEEHARALNRLGFVF